MVNPGKRLSLQRHKLREEHWFIAEGQANIFIDEKKIVLKKGESIDVTRGQIHRIANDTNKPLVFIEVQTGDHFGEDDIERLEDDYNR
ncbi:MAG: phosphomannose isomerase type II C-terminal cupin domain [Candidatus Omnitrophica bacterium]|nr:phosphomannose isomerase type II C-terminal cupin domain [Candidatus Omnitrophota bacterium]